MVNRSSHDMGSVSLPAASLRNRMRRQAAFSLIEVVIALSVVALAVLTIVGMLSDALLNFGSAEQKTSFTQIHDQVLHDVQQLQWPSDATAEAFTPTSPVYFDAQADELPTSTSTGVIYQAIVAANDTVYVPSSGSESSGTPEFQYANSGGTALPSMVTVTTSIYRYPGPTSGVTPLAWYTDYVARYN